MTVRRIEGATTDANPRALPERRSNAVVGVEPALLGRADAARFLALSLRSLDELARRGDITAVRVPGMRRCAFAVDELRAVAARWQRRAAQ